MSSNKLPYMEPSHFTHLLRELNKEALTPEHDTIRTAQAVQYMGQYSNRPHWPKKPTDLEKDETLLRAIHRVDWSLYHDNLVYVARDFYPYLEECIERNDPFVDKIRETRFAKLCALAYALVSDVHPGRRKNLHSRIEAWSGVDVDENAETMLTGLFDAWARHDASLALGNYGAVIQALDPQSSRSALVLNNLYQMFQGDVLKQPDSIEFEFGASF